MVSSPNQARIFNSEFPEYVRKNAAMQIRYLSHSSGIMSSMITGPSNFPVRRMEKINNANHRILEELLAFRKKSRSQIAVNLGRGGTDPISTLDSRATSKIADKVGSLEAIRDDMKRINAEWRKRKGLTLDKAGQTALVHELMANALPETKGYAQVPADIGYSWEKTPIASYALTNIGAQIRSAKQRHVEIEKEQAHTEAEGEVVLHEADTHRIWTDPDEQRVKLKFDTKPGPEIRAMLKHNGWRWSPTRGVHMRYLNNASRDAAQRTHAELTTMFGE